MSTKTRIIIGLLIGSWLIAGEIVYSHMDSVALVRIPPQSLAKWYQPENKRHVWLHTMFNLRREVQAIRAYAREADKNAVAEWVEKFSEHYNKLGEMVPEWESKLDRTLLTQLQEHQASANFTAIPSVLNEMQENCDSCHDRFRAVTALLYRAPDFTNSQIEPTQTYSESKVALNKTVNEIKLSFVAGRPDKALESLSVLKSGMDELGGTCVQCHKHTPKSYPNDSINKAMDDLDAQLHTTDVSIQGRALGALAVLACAECHGSHRIVADTRQLLTRSTSIGELLAH